MQLDLSFRVRCTQGFLGYTGYFRRPRDGTLGLPFSGDSIVRSIGASLEPVGCFWRSVPLRGFDRGILKPKGVRRNFSSTVPELESNRS